MMARSSGELYISARAARNTGAKIDRPSAGVALGGRHQDRLVRHAAHAVPGVVVAIAEEQEEVEGVGLLADVVDQRRAGRAFAVEPRDLVGDRVAPLEHLRRSLAEVLRVALARDREAAHRDAVDRLGALGVVRLPGDVVVGAGGQHLDAVPPRQHLGDVAGVQLRAAADVGAVALDDDRELHGSPESSPAGRGVGSSPPLPDRSGAAGDAGGSDGAGVDAMGSAAMGAGRDVGRVVRTIVVAGAVAGLRSAVVAVVAESVVRGLLTGHRRAAGCAWLAAFEAAAPATAPASAPPRTAAVARIGAGRAAAAPGTALSASSAPAGAAAGGRCRRRRQRRPRPILHDAFEGAGAALVEVEPRAQRLDQHPQVLHFDAQPRRLDDEVVEHLEVERVELVAGLQALADPGEQLAVLRC